MPINSEGNAKSKQGKANQCPDRIFQAKGPVGKIQVGTEDHLFVFAKDHIHFKLFGRSMKTPVVFNVHSDEGRTVPSVTSVLERACEVIWLDVEDIHAD